MRSQTNGQALNSAEAAAMSQAGTASSSLLQNALAQADSHSSTN